MASISLNDFKDIIREEVQKICTLKNLNIDIEKQRSTAFNLWIADFYKNNNRYIDTDPEDALLGETRDLKVDLCLEDETNKVTYLIQGEYLGIGKKSSSSSIDESKVESFFGNHENLMDTKWIRKYGSKQAQEALIDYKKQITNQGYEFHYIFISTGKASERVHEVTNRWNKKYNKQDLPIDCTLLDITNFKQEYATAQSIEESIPDQVEFYVKEDSFFEKEEPFYSIIASIKGNTLKNLWREHKDRLFSYNIRTYLGEKGINKDIVYTAENDPENFFYFNNGISAVCTELSLNKNKITAKKFQIINGAQTVGSLKAIEDQPNLEILIRISETASKSSAKLNEKIIQYNNTQNKITLSDFRANDPIQIDLQNKFSKLNCQNLRSVNYMRKRGDRYQRKQAINLKLEEVAKIRYAYLHEPCRVISSAKDLWKTGENGKYEKAFGNSNKIEDMITDQNFEKSFVLPVIFHENIISLCKQRATEDEDLKYLKRFRFHFLYFIKKSIDYIRDKKEINISIKKLLNNKDYLDTFFVDIFEIIYDQINDLVIDETDKQTGPQNAPIRDLTISRDHLDKLHKKIEKKIARKDYSYL